MKRIADDNQLNKYIQKYNLESILDEELLKYIRLFSYEKEEHILEAGSKLEYYYFLVEGKIKVYYLFENGKSMLLKFYKDFITIGDLELFKDIPVLCNIDAIEKCHLLAIPSDLLRKSYFTNVKFLSHLVASLSDKLYATINNSSYNFVYPLINRLASYFMGYLTDKDYIVLNSSYLDMAQFLGTTYRHLNRTLHEMELKNIIKCEGRRVSILDVKALNELSKNIYVKTL